MTFHPAIKFLRTVSRVQKWGLSLLMVLALTACGDLPFVSFGSVPVLSQLELVSVTSTDKTIGDHLVSWSSGKNCSTVRTERGQTYCVEDAIVQDEKLYCYRTLGDVTCYHVADPYAQGATTVDRAAVQEQKDLTPTSPFSIITGRK